MSLTLGLYIIACGDVVFSVLLLQPYPEPESGSGSGTKDRGRDRTESDLTDLVGDDSSFLSLLSLVTGSPVNSHKNILVVFVGEWPVSA